MASGLTLTSSLFALILVWSRAADASTWYVNVGGTGDAPTIQAAIDFAEPGDEVLVDAGLYSWSNQGGDSAQVFGPSMLVMRSDITVRSLSGPESTILDAEGLGRVIVCDAVFDARIEGFTIRGGHAYDPNGIPEADLQGQGGGILCRFSAPVIEGCIIEENQAQHEGGGVVVFDSSPSLLFNVIARNQALTTAGIRVGGTTSNPEIRSNTIVENFGSAVVVFSASAAISQNIIAKNLPGALPGTGVGLHCTFATVVVECNNIWMNAEPNVGCTDPGGMSEDPLFCVTSVEYELQPGSPCLPENSSCNVLTGARGVGCTVTDVADTQYTALQLRVEIRDRPSFFFMLPRGGEIVLTVFDVRGRRVSEVFSGYQEAGYRRIDWVGRVRKPASGVYFARLWTASSGTKVTRFLQLR